MDKRMSRTIDLYSTNSKIIHSLSRSHTNQEYGVQLSVQLLDVTIANTSNEEGRNEMQTDPQYLPRLTIQHFRRYYLIVLFLYFLVCYHKQGLMQACMTASIIHITKLCYKEIVKHICLTKCLLGPKSCRRRVFQIVNFMSR